MAITSATFARPRAVARALARRTPVNIDLARIRARSAQPTGAFIVRLTVTAVFAYLLALFQPGSARSMLAPLTAVLVVQATVYRTVRSAVQRVISVVAGVLVALALSAALGFTWWSLGLTIAAALAIGSMLRLGDHVLKACGEPRDSCREGLTGPITLSSYRSVSPHYMCRYRWHLVVL